MCGCLYTRNRKTYSGIKDMYGYFRCIAAGQSGSHGAEVAISKSFPFAIDAEGNKIFVEREHVSILFSDLGASLLGSAARL